MHKYRLGLMRSVGVIRCDRPPDSWRETEEEPKWLFSCGGEMGMAGLPRRLFRWQWTSEPRCSAVVPAVGSSTRMEDQDKLLLPSEEQPVLLYTLRVLELCPYLVEIIVVTREDLIVPVG